MRSLLSRLLLVLGVLLLTQPAFAAPSAEEQAVDRVLRSWSALSDAVQVERIADPREKDGVRTLGGTVTVYGHKCGIDVSYFKAPSKQNKNDPERIRSELRRISIDFPDQAKLSSDHFKKLFKLKPSDLFPGGHGMEVGLKHLAIDILGGKIDGAEFALTFGSWAPGGGKNKKVTLTDIQLAMAVNEIQTRPRVEATMSSHLFLPKNLAKTMGIGETTLELQGSVKTRPVTIELGASLSSDEIPLDAKKSLVLKKAKMLFVYRGGKPGLALGGQLELRPKGQEPIALNGEVSIDVSGSVYAEGWMDQNDHWKNPFGISPDLYLEKAGLGFGANFATAIPTPIVAVEGGLRLKDSRGRTRAQGSATLGFHSSNPSQTVVDLELGSLKLSEFLDAFSKTPVPSDMKRTLDKMKLNKLHVTVVPPGPGVTLFGISYEPALKLEADVSFDGLSGKLYLKSDDQGIEAFGTLSTIKAPGFKLTGSRRGTDPYFYLVLKPNDKQLAMALNGKVEVLGGGSVTDVYFSDKGFSATFTTRIQGGFNTKLDVAGTAFGGNPTVFVSAAMNSDADLAKRIGKIASESIKRAAKDTKRDFEKHERNLESLRPKLNSKKKTLDRKRREARARLKKDCAKVDQRKAQEAEKKRKEKAIRALKAKIASAERAIRAKPAKNLRSLSCPRGWHKFKGRCWKCSSGYKHDIVQPWDGSKACFKSKSIFHKPTYKRASKGNDTSCRKPLIPDLGSCWQCPSGYVRRVSVHSIKSSKACDVRDFDARARRINGDKIKLAGMETDLTLITKGIGKLASEVSGAAAKICAQGANSDAINLHPHVSPTYAEWGALSLQVNEAQKLVKDFKKTAVDGLNTAAWITKNAAKGLSVVQVNSASFEGCASALNGGRVAMKIAGKVADKRFSGSFNMNLKSPDGAIRALAEGLLKNKSPRATFSNGKCKRPQISRPDLKGTPIGARLASLNRSKKSLRARPKNQKAKSPSWAQPRMVKALPKAKPRAKVRSSSRAQSTSPRSTPSPRSTSKSKRKPRSKRKPKSRGRSKSKKRRNLALKKRTFQSSVYRKNAGQGFRAVDGNTSGKWKNGSVTHTRSRKKKKEWWAVDLGAVHEIDTVEIYNRTDCCKGRLNNFVILVRNSTKEKFRRFTPRPQRYRKGQKTKLVFRGKQKARYVRVQMLRPGILSLAEVKVWGK